MALAGMGSMGRQAMTAKVCTKCGSELAATPEFFHLDASKRDGLAPSCKACRCRAAREYRDANGDDIRRRARDSRAANQEAFRERDRRAYLRNHDARLANNATYRDAHREEAALYFAKRARRFTKTLGIWKQTQGCCACGKREGKLDYHHRDGQTKLYNVAAMHNCSIEALIDEIGKCVVLCASCHGRLHHRLRQMKAAL